MGSRKTNKKTAEPAAERKPEDNNWEIPEEEVSGVRCQVSDTGEPVPEELKDFLAGLQEPEDRKRILSALKKVDPQLRSEAPVWKVGLHEKDCVFVFRNGKKVRVEL